MRKSVIFIILVILAGPSLATGQPVYSCETYPDEAGFMKRIEVMLPRIMARGYGKRSLAESKCPDTGLPVRAWAVEGEEIISPYTGRKYTQGPTGYFGPKARNSNGEITAFGGDPLKYDLQPATAALLLDPGDSVARAFLGIPGNLSQQYHFACCNWARFYPLLAGKMGTVWQQKFARYVGEYQESRRPSDGGNEWLPMKTPHTLVGEPGYLLGGNSIDGGTENHKTMWRTSCLLYSQLLPDTAKISGYTASEAGRLTKEMLRDYVKRLLVTGNGEYDSQVYYPYSITGFLNLYDFSPDRETKDLAKVALDYYFVTYGLKVIDGTIAGAQKRGYLAGTNPSDMEIMLWAFFDHTSRDMTSAVTSVHQATTTYRPNKVIYNIITKNVKKPFEAKISRPFYHMDRPGAYAEYFYCSSSYAIGNIQMTVVDNPNQQMVWSVVTRGDGRPYCFSGGHPMRGSTSGHSPYTQTLQSKGTLMLITAPSRDMSGVDVTPPPTPPGKVRANMWLLSEADQGKAFESRNRARYALKPLHTVTLPQHDVPGEIERFWKESKNSASSWFYYPRELKPVVSNGCIGFETGNMFLALVPLTSTFSIVAPEDLSLIKDNEARSFFSSYSLVVFPGQVSGYIVETGEKAAHGKIGTFISRVCSQGIPDAASLKDNAEISWRSISGDLMKMRYMPGGLRCKGWINGRKQNWDNYTGGVSYDSPLVKVNKGIMKVSDGKESYEIDYSGNIPIFRELTSH